MSRKFICIPLVFMTLLLIPFIVIRFGISPSAAPAAPSSSGGTASSSQKAAQSSSSSQKSPQSSAVPGGNSIQVFNTIPSLEDLPYGMSPNGVITLKIIDISKWTTISNWDTLKSNVDGIYIKATEGRTYTDPTLSASAKAAAGRKIPIGFYHYFWPSSSAQNVRQQADYFYNTIKKYSYDFHPVLDIEMTNGQDAKTIASNVKTFAQEFSQKAHQQIMIYCSPNFANKYLNDQSLKQYPLWIANYNVNAPKVTLIWTTFDVWQFNTTLSLPGVSGRVDADIATTDIYLDPGKAPKY